MIAATYDDLVMGVCTHYEMVPTPAPTPTPIPHPFVSMIADPANEAAKKLSQPMKAAAGAKLEKDRPFAIYGSAMANTGVVGKNSSVLPHLPLPPGTAWAPMPKPPKQPVGVMETPPPPDSPAMPAGDAVLHKGSSKVHFARGDTVRLGDPAQSCSEPARQSSTVLAIPKGPPVLMGG